MDSSTVGSLLIIRCSLPEDAVFIAMADFENDVGNAPVSDKSLLSHIGHTPGIFSSISTSSGISSGAP